MEEREAIARLRSGDPSGLEPLVRAHQRPALRVALAITRDAMLAEDVVQDAFLRAYERIDRFDISRPFRPWFLRSVANAALRVMERRGRLSSLEDDSASTGSASGDPGPEQRVERAETSDELWHALAELSPALRAAVVLRYYVGLSEAEAAAELGCARGTVKWRLSAARKRLRELLRALAAGRDGVASRRVHSTRPSDRVPNRTRGE